MNESQVNIEQIANAVAIAGGAKKQAPETVKAELQLKRSPDVVELKLKEAKEQQTTQSEEDRRVIKQAVKGLNSIFQEFKKGLRFDVYEETDQIIAQIVNLDSNEVVREYPPEELLQLQERIRRQVGMIIDSEI